MTKFLFLFRLVLWFVSIFIVCISMHNYFFFYTDLSLLENAARYSVEKSKSEKPIKFEKKKSFQHPQAFQALQRACYRRNRCRLLGLPYHFSRHRENTSTYDTPNDTILWKISWMVPHHVTNIIVSDRYCNDTYVI